MSFYYRNPSTGQYEQTKIPIVKGETGFGGIHVGVDEPPTTEIEMWFDPSDGGPENGIHARLNELNMTCTDYMGVDRKSVKDAMDANVDFMLNHIDEDFNTMSYEGQNITANHAIERQVKNATLKGQTLVNMATDFEDIVNHTLSSYYHEKTICSTSQLNVGDTLTLIYTVEVHEDAANGIFSYGNLGFGVGVNSFNADAISSQLRLTVNGVLAPAVARFKIKTDGTPNVIKIEVLGVPDFEYLALRPLRRETTSTEGQYVVYSATKCMLLRGDHSECPPEYFEGMQSVKNPVLTTIGKNLFDVDLFTREAFVTRGALAPINNGFELHASSNDCHTTNAVTGGVASEYVKKFLFKVNSPSLSFSFDKTADVRTVLYMTFLDEKFNFVDIILLSYSTGGTKKATVSVPLNAKYSTMRFGVSLSGERCGFTNIQIEQDSSTSEYEPHKSNTVTPLDELELLSEESTLDLVTGEVYEPYKRVVVNDKTFDYYLQSINDYGIANFSFALVDLSISANTVICDKLQRQSSLITDTDSEGFYISGNNVFIRVKSSTASTVQKFKDYLASNPHTFMYALDEPVVKTVTLTNKPVAFEGVTHYTVSSEGLTPTLSIDVPTDLSAVASEQYVMTTKQRSELDSLTIKSEQLKAAQDEQELTLIASEFDTEYRLMLLESARQ